MATKPAMLSDLMLIIAINNNIIEQVTDFKYFGYHISEDGSDFEDKLQTCNKINGAIRKTFWKKN